MIELESVPILPRGVRLHFDKVRQQWFLLGPERALQLNAVAYAVLSRVNGEATFAAIIDDLGNHFSAPTEAIKHDSEELLASLQQRLFLDISK